MTVADSSDKSLLELFLWFIEQVVALKDNSSGLKSLTIEKGRTKAGRPENLTLQIQRGEILSIVGPTGSGKSRLWEDIEYLACGDNPSGRRVLINIATHDPLLALLAHRRVVVQNGGW